jgi:hypothetical protein
MWYDILEGSNFQRREKFSNFENFKSPETSKEAIWQRLFSLLLKIPLVKAQISKQIFSSMQDLHS